MTKKGNGPQPMGITGPGSCMKPHGKRQPPPKAPPEKKEQKLPSEIVKGPDLMDLAFALMKREGSSKTQTVLFTLGKLDGIVIEASILGLKAWDETREKWVVEGTYQLYTPNSPSFSAPIALTAVYYPHTRTGTLKIDLEVQTNAQSHA